MASSFNYGSAAKMADGLLKYFGTTATITRRVEGAYDVSTSQAAIKSSKFTATVVALDIRNKRDGDAVERGDRRILLSPNASYEPLVGDLVKVGSTEYIVQEVEKIAPAGVTVIYDLAVGT